MEGITTTCAWTWLQSTLCAPVMIRRNSPSRNLHFAEWAAMVVAFGVV